MRRARRLDSGGVWRAAAAVAGVSLGSAGSLAQPGFGDEPDHSSARLVSTTTALVAGQTNWINLEFTLDPGWHIYWDGQNDTGFPPSIEIDWPAGWELRDVVAPVPTRHVAAGDLLDHVLEGRPVLRLLVYVSSETPRGEVTITGESSWLVCETACLLDSESLNLTVPVVESGSTVEKNPVVTDWRDLWEVYLGRSKASVPAGFDAEWNGNEVRIHAREATQEDWEPGSAIEYYPVADSAKVENLLEGGRSESGTLVLKIGTGEKEGTPALHGLVALIEPSGVRRAYWISMNRPGTSP